MVPTSQTAKPKQEGDAQRVQGFTGRGQDRWARGPQTHTPDCLATHPDGLSAQKLLPHGGQKESFRVRPQETRGVDNTHILGRGRVRQRKIIAVIVGT